MDGHGASFGFEISPQTVGLDTLNLDHTCCGSVLAVQRMLERLKDFLVLDRGIVDLQNDVLARRAPRDGWFQGVNLSECFSFPIQGVNRPYVLL